METKTLCVLSHIAAGRIKQVPTTHWDRTLALLHATYPLGDFHAYPSLS